jgi:hypothetical protein
VAGGSVKKKEVPRRMNSRPHLTITLISQPDICLYCCLTQLFDQRFIVNHYLEVFLYFLCKYAADMVQKKETQSNTIKKMNGDVVKKMVALHSGIIIQEVSVLSCDVCLFRLNKSGAHMLRLIV